MTVRKHVRRKLIGISGALALTIGLVLGQGLTSPASAAEILLDGGFEAGASGDSPNWTEADSLFDTPLCTAAGCGTGGGTATPHGGTVWAWFGGAAAAGHTGSLTQTLTIPAGTKAVTYWYRNGAVAAPFDATLTVKVDGTTVKTHTEAPVAQAAYTQQLANISAFADGGSHTLSFNYLNGGTGLTNMTIDDVSIETTLDPATTATPTVTATDPASPAPSATPKVQGTAEAGSTVTLYGNNACTGASLGTGTAADFAGAGITATVALGSTTTFYAQASNAGQFDSACSTTTVTYVNNAPTTGTPTVTSTDPAGPASSTTPKVKGTAEAGSTVSLFDNATCTGTELGSGPAAEFEGAGITASVPNDATTTIYAQATKAGQVDSACSSTFATYVNDSTVPNTTITSPTTGAVVKSLVVPVTFTSSEPGSTFTCKVDTGAFAACNTGSSITVTPGAHTVQVVAKDSAGNADASPATVTFTAYDCKTLVAAETAAQAKADAADKKVAKAKKALKKAKKSGDAKKIAKAKKKLKKAKKAAKAAKAALASAQAAAAPCGGTTMKQYARK
jgi:hypothetical protein